MLKTNSTVVGGSFLDGNEALESEGLAGHGGGLDPLGEAGVLVAELDSHFLRSTNRFTFPSKY